MLRLIKIASSMPRLLLPAVLPSWNFFDYIVPSPRIELALFDSEGEVTRDWQEFRPRPDTLPVSQMLKRMLWNPYWNENLFLTSCAERLLSNATKHSEDAIFLRIHTSLKNELGADDLSTQVQFRLYTLRREGNDLVRETCFKSRMEQLTHTGEA